MVFGDKADISPLSRSGNAVKEYTELPDLG